MTLQKVSLLFVALFLVLYAVSAFGWIAVSAVALGIVALIAGVLVFVWVLQTP